MCCRSAREADFFQSFFVEPEADDFDSIWLDQENRGTWLNRRRSTRDSLGRSHRSRSGRSRRIRQRISWLPSRRLARCQGTLRFFRTVDEPLKKGKCELADGTRNFEECGNYRTFIEQGGKGIVFAVRILQRKCGSLVPCYDVSHLPFRSKMRESQRFSAMRPL